jgi:UDP-GlcNAc:undecaprenyl-phosphate GlcNAc-1-phosphate transferase
VSGEITPRLKIESLPFRREWEYTFALALHGLNGRDAARNGPPSMTPSLLAAVVGTGVAAGLTPLVRHIAHWLGAVDTPGGRRIHAQATPRLGGLAIAGGYWAALTLCATLGMMMSRVVDPRSIGFYLLGGLVMIVVGALDDVKPVGAKRKLLAQIIAATLCWYGGARILDHLVVPGIGLVEFGPVFSYVATVFWILAFTNAINLIDGLDGLAGGVVFFASLTNLVVALVSGNPIAAILNAALGGAVLGFLFYNFNPATIFMGDTGSLFIGYSLGAAALLSWRQKESTLVSLLVPLIALGLPFTDTLLAMVRRFLARRSILSADREHLHHRLLDLGLTHKRVVLLLYGCSILLCAAAMAAAFGKSWQVGAALVGALLTLLGITRFTSRFEFVLFNQTQRARLLAGSAGTLRKIVPDLIVGLNRAKSVPGLWAAMEAAFVDNDLVLAARTTHQGEPRPTWEWQAEIPSQRREGRITELSFPVAAYPGGHKATLSFVCLTDEAALPPQSEIQLQLIADAVQTALMRLNVESPRGMMREVSATVAR